MSQTLHIRGGMTHDVTRGSLASFIDKVYLHIYTNYTERQGGADLEFLVKFWVKKYNILYAYVTVSC